MLKITPIPSSDSAQMIKLEGKLLEPWLAELREACTAVTGGTGRIRLDLSAVTFVDAMGIALLRELIRHGVEVAACSDFVRELLQREMGGTLHLPDPGC